LEKTSSDHSRGRIPFSWLTQPILWRGIFVIILKNCPFPFPGIFALSELILDRGSMPIYRASIAQSLSKCPDGGEKEPAACGRQYASETIRLGGYQWPLQESKFWSV
jgi:hypothetical protein